MKLNDLNYKLLDSAWHVRGTWYIAAIITVVVLSLGFEHNTLGVL